MRNASERPPIAALVGLHCAGGAGAGLLFGAALLLLDVSGLRGLVVASADPATWAIFLLGAMLAFAPAVICVSVGMLPAYDDTRTRDVNRAART